MGMPGVKLYNFFRSGTSHPRAHRASAQGTGCGHVPVNLRTGAAPGRRLQGADPPGLVPALEQKGRVLIQSAAIIEWMEEHYPTPATVDADIDEPRARTRFGRHCRMRYPPGSTIGASWSLCQRLGAMRKAVTAWRQHWIVAGFDALETMRLLMARRRDFCFGSTPTLADV